MHVHMSMCVTRIPSAGGFACPGDGVETARSRTTCSCWTYVREPVLKSAAVLCRGVAWVWLAVLACGCPLSGERGVRASDRRRSSGARRGRAPCGAWRNASQRPCVPRPNTRGGHGGGTARDDAPARPGRARPAAAGGAHARGVPETVFLQKWSRVLFVLGGITGPRTLQQVFSARASVSARARLRSAVSSVSHSISLPSRVRICRAAMLIFAGARPTHGR